MTDPQPRSPLQRVDHAIWHVERWLAGSLFLFMALLMFVQVVWRVMDRQLAKAEATGYDRIAIMVGILVVVSVLGARTSPRKDGSRRPWAGSVVVGGIAAAIGVAFVGAVMKVFPNGLVWGPGISLSAMLWVALLGASLATYEKRHLTLEMGEKIWPRKMLPFVQAFAYLTAVAACVVLLLLAYESIADHRAGWVHNPLTGVVPDTKLPYWVVFLIFPYTFVIMGLRFLGLAVKSASTRAAEKSS